MELRVRVIEQIDYVARTLARLGVHACDLEDLTQEVLIVALRRAEIFDPSRRLEPWLFGIARNVARDFRRLARHRVEARDPDAVALRVDAGGSPADLTAQRRRVHALRAAIAGLEDPLQELVVLHDLEELPMADVAASLGIPIDTAYARLRRGRAAVRARLAESGGLHGE